MWSLIYTAISEHLGGLELLGDITDEELETNLLHLQNMDLVEISDVYTNLFDEPVSRLEE